MAWLMSVVEAADALNLSPSLVRRYCRRGDLKAQRVGRDWVIDSGDVARFRPRKPGRPKQR